jgi:hypothetical protein
MIKKKKIKLEWKYRMTWMKYKKYYKKILNRSILNLKNNE